MKYAKSLALGGELVHAAEVGYGMTTEYQIVCWACHEPVFKVGSEITKRQYFAHYRRKPDSNCEQRVIAMARAAFQRRPLYPRGQDLQGFLQHFERILAEGFPQKAVAHIERMRARTIFRKAIYILRNHIADACRDENTRAALYSAYELDREGQMALIDVVEYLLSPNSFRARMFAICYGLIQFNRVISEDEARGDFVADPLKREIVSGLLVASDRELGRFLAEYLGADDMVALTQMISACLLGAANAFLDSVTGLSREGPG
jgi:hypothetical protein